MAVSLLHCKQSEGADGHDLARWFCSRLVLGANVSRRGQASASQTFVVEELPGRNQKSTCSKGSKWSLD